MGRCAESKVLLQKQEPRITQDKVLWLQAPAFAGAGIGPGQFGEAPSCRATPPSRARAGMTASLPYACSIAVRRLRSARRAKTGSARIANQGSR